MAITRQIQIKLHIIISVSNCERNTAFTLGMVQQDTRAVLVLSQRDISIIHELYISYIMDRDDRSIGETIGNQISQYCPLNSGG
jgi:hypothetical protein